ncbi:MAG: hypothetical protein ABI224_14100 [Acetobacteraceae bacterium]
MDNISLLPEPAPALTSDSNRVRLGGGYRLPMPAPAEIADSGYIRLGGGYRLPADRTAA